MTALNSEGLLPCPFCGNDGSGPIEDSLQIIHSEPDWVQESRHRWTVQCDKCTATMGYSDSEEEAISAWNRRALSQASFVIAGLRAERITAERDALDAYGKLQTAEARISSLEEENKKLREALDLSLIGGGE